MLTLGTNKPMSAEAQALIGCPIGSAFDFVGHGFFQNYKRWNPQVVELEPLSDEQPGVGATARQVTLDQGILSESTFEIATFSPPKHLALRGLSEPFRSFYEFQDGTAGSTELAFTFELEERKVFMRPFNRLVVERLQEGAQQTVANLKQLLESQHARGGSSSEQLAQFICAASLDLQDPLRRIEALSDLLEAGLGSSNKRGISFAREAIRNCTMRARKLVDDLLTYSSTILGEQQLQILNLREEIESALAALSDPIVETKADIGLDVGAISIVADRSQFACLMQNMIWNAIQYRKPSEPPGIDITATAFDEETIRLAIVDHGIGFDDEFAPAIFEPFRMPCKGAKYAGTGIELAICKSIADRHGWVISVKSRPGEGTSFSFLLPAVVGNGAHTCETTLRRAVSAEERERMRVNFVGFN